MDSILAAVPAAAPSSASIGGGVLVALLVGGIVWYAVKHKGRDWPTVLMGYVLCIAISGLTWGAAMNGVVSNGLATGAGALVHAISSVR